MKVPSDMKPGDLLAQADLASYIGAMAKGVAEAQKALDDNTMGLLGEFAQPIPGLANKSLLQLGLSPAFYHFRSASLSCSVSMTLQVREEIEVAVHLGIGTSKDSSASTASSTKQTESTHDKVTFSDQFVAKSNASTSGMEALDSYSESNTSTHFVLAERVALDANAKSGLQANGLIRYDAETALFVVPPHGKYWVVFGFETGSGATTFTVKASGAFSPGQLPDATALATAFMQHLTSSPPIGTVYMLPSDGGVVELTRILFENDSYLVKTVDGKDYQVRLRALAQIVAAAGLGPVTVTGHTDGLGPTDYNKRLSELRAQSVAAILRANGVTVESVTGLGEQNAGGIQTANKDLRKVEIVFKASLPGRFVYAEDDLAAFSPSMGTPVLSGNGLRAAAAYADNGVGKQGNTVVASALELEQQFSSNSELEASVSGELVYLTYSETSNNKVANVKVYRDQSSSQTAQQTTNLDAEQESATESALSQAGGTKVNRASAVVASLDARYARMFDLTMSGNMSIAAELVSIPAPPEFLQFIKNYLED